MANEEKRTLERAADAIHNLLYSIQVDGVNLETLSSDIESYDYGKAKNVEATLKIIKQVLPESNNNEIQEIFTTINDVVSSTLNDGSTVQTFDDLKAFLNQAIPAWQNAIKNQTVFQQQFYQFPSNN